MRLPFLVVALIVLMGTLSQAALPPAVNALANNCVRVASSTAPNESWGASGVYLGGGYVMTAKHLFIDDRRGTTTREATVTFRADGEKIHGWWVSDTRSPWDYAVVRLDREPATALPDIQPSRDVGPGDVLWVGGYSHGKLVYRHGPFSGFRRVAALPRGPEWYVEFKAPCYSGDSGGPVFLSDGTLVGTMWGSGVADGHNPNCSNEQHRAYTVAICAKLTRRLFRLVFPGKGGRKAGNPSWQPRRPGSGGGGSPDCPNCPPGGCPNEQPGGEHRWGEDPDAQIQTPTEDYPDDQPIADPPKADPPQAGLSEVLAELGSLRQAIADIQLQPGPRGEPGPIGGQGTPGSDGQPGEPGPAFDVKVLTDADIEALAARLPAISFRHVNGDTGQVILPAEPVHLGQGYEFLQFPSNREKPGRLPHTKP